MEFTSRRWGDFSIYAIFAPKTFAFNDFICSFRTMFLFFDFHLFGYIFRAFRMRVSGVQAFTFHNASRIE